MAKNKELIMEFQKRFQTINEYVVTRGLVEDDDPNAMGGAPDPSMGGGDPAAMGGAPDPSMGGGDPAAMGGAPDPSMGGGDPAAMGGAPDPSMGGGDPAAMGGEGGAQAPEGFNPQEADPAAMGGAPDPSMGGGEGEMQPDDEVVDISDLTDAQEDMSDDIKHVGAKFDKLFKTLGGLEAMLKANDDKINALTAEFEKRNPTNVEKLGMQAAKSYPFNVKPEDYWRDKTENSNYSLEDDNNGKGDENYAITNSDVNDNNWRDIIKSFDDEDSFMYNQTLNNLLHIR